MDGMEEELGKRPSPSPSPSPSPPSPSPDGPSCDNDPFADILPCSESLGGSLVLLVSPES